MSAESAKEDVWTQDEVTRWIKLYTEKLCVVYSTPDIHRVIKWNRMRWAVHVACMEE